MNKQTKVWLVLSIALSLLALGSACGGGGDTNKEAMHRRHSRRSSTLQRSNRDNLRRDYLQRHAAGAEEDRHNGRSGLRPKESEFDDRRHDC